MDQPNLHPFHDTSELRLAVAAGCIFRIDPENAVAVRVKCPRSTMRQNMVTQGGQIRCRIRPAQTATPSADRCVVNEHDQRERGRGRKGEEKEERKEERGSGKRVRGGRTEEERRRTGGERRRRARARSVAPNGVAQARRRARLASAAATAGHADGKPARCRAPCARHGYCPRCPMCLASGAVLGIYGRTPTR